MLISLEILWKIVLELMHETMGLDSTAPLGANTVLVISNNNHNFIVIMLIITLNT